MSAAKHSPGPWEANGPFVNSVAVTGIADCSRADIAENWAGSDYSSHARAEANARLIAAAPELLEAAKRIEKRIAYYASMAEAGQPNIEQWAYTDQSGDVKALRDAIAKAEVQS